MTGFDPPTSGTIELDGRDVTRWRPHRRGREGLARTFQHSRSFRSLTSARTSRSPRSASGPLRARRGGAPSELLALLGLETRRTPRPASLRARRRAPARRRPRARDRAALRADGRAGRGASRGGGPGVRRGRPLDSRRPRGRRPPDRPQHGADHGRVRPHPGARPGTDARRGDAAEIRANLDVAAAYLGESAVARTRRDGRAARLEIDGSTSATAASPPCATSTSRWRTARSWG